MKTNGTRSDPMHANSVSRDARTAHAGDRNLTIIEDNKKNIATVLYVFSIGDREN